MLTKLKATTTSAPADETSDEFGSELYKKHRPRNFDALIGETGNVGIRLKNMILKNHVPHFILFSGNSGCGKTTLARIFKRRMEISDIDYTEINASSTRGIDVVRDIEENMSMSAVGGKNRLWVIDEAHGLTADAQKAFLRVLEDTPKHVYFIFCTTDPQKLHATIRTRATEMKVKPLTEEDVITLCRKVCRKEGLHRTFTTDNVFRRISEVCEGSARKALVILNQIVVSGEVSEDKQIALIDNNDSVTFAIDVARLLIKGAKWKEITPILKTMTDEPETVRRVILGYANSVLLGGGWGMERAFALIDCFSENLYDSGRAGLTAACYAMTKQK
jgi:DNA polymerase III gamma/tau subunit